MTKAEETFLNRFKTANKEDLPDFSKCVHPLDMALWVLAVAKDKCGENKLTADLIVLAILETQEISIDVNSIIRSLSRASNKVHRHREKNEIYFEIMKPGRKHILALIGADNAASALYFEPGMKFTAKKQLRILILDKLNGQLKIVDPYCGERTLDVLGSIEDKAIRFLTRLENLREKERTKFLRELSDFKSEKTNIEFRNYINPDLHDRYIISENELVIIGHSIKDLGAKETFSVVLSRIDNNGIYESLNNNFDSKWHSSTVI